jgi:aryl carrier-like protein
VESLERIRRALAAVLPEPDVAPSLDANLLELGLHSLAIMSLIEPLSELAGRRLDYAELARRPSLGAWVRLCERT